MQDIIDKKTLRVFADSSVKNDGVWLRVFRDALVKFNGLKLGVTLVEEPTDPPDPLTLAGAHVQFATGAGTITAQARGKPQSGTLVGTDLHGHTFTFRDPGIVKAFIFVPATPTIGGGGRQAGDPIRLYIAVHELLHACGLQDSDHNPEAIPDVFCSEPTASMNPIQGATEADDRMRVGPPRQDKSNIFPPIKANGRTRTGIQRLWNP
jgi:hypothetical protein